ncbi:MAG: IS66 family transposase [Lachnospiraceae bacterium]|nr:IS66 family transposase [Candidatus Hippenecus merdae]
MKYTAEELNQLSKSEVIDLMLSMQSREDSLEKQMAFLTEQLDLMKQARFGRKSEKDLVEDDGQLTLSCIFNEAEVLMDQSFIVPEPKIEDAVPAAAPARKKKQKGKRVEDLKGFPSEPHDHPISEAELDSLFPEGWKELPPEKYQRLCLIPQKFYVEDHTVHIYCSRKNTNIIVRGDHSDDLLRNSIVTPSLEAAVINAKFVNAIPYDRLSKEFERNGVHISSTNMAGWTIKCSEYYLADLYEELRKELLKVPVIQADETPVLVSKDGRPSGSKSWMWIYRTGCREPVPPVILYEYQKTRNASHPREFLDGYNGVCVTDGYQVYHTLADQKEGLVIAGCWAHARRKFAEVVKSVGEEKAKDTIAYKALKIIAAIYQADNALTGLSKEELLTRRQKEVKPLVEAFFEWARVQTSLVSAQSETGKGLAYCLNQEKYLKVFLDNARVPMDNNASERAIRPFCVGKHNWHLIDTIRGAKASAIVYSLVETAKANNLKPYEYFTYILTELPKIPKELRAGQLARLMPWAKELPENCILKK